MWGENLTKTEGFETKAVGTNYQSTVTVSEAESDCEIGWSIYYGTVSTNDKISGSNSAQMRYYNNKDDRGYVQSTTAVEGLSNVAFKARVSSLDMKLTVSYSADGSAWTALATNVAFEATGSSGVKTLNYDIPAGGKYIKFEVAEGSTKPSSGNIKLIIDDVVFTYASQGGEEPVVEPTTKTIYLNGGGSSLWNQANPEFFVHSWGGAADGDVHMTLVEGDVYKADIPADNTNLLFLRLATGTTEIVWSGDAHWNQSTDQTIPEGKDLFTMTSWDNGEWSVYTAQGGDDPDPIEPTPAEKDSIYFVNVAGWTAPRVHLWGGTAAGTEWPGVEMTKLEDQINNYDVYKYVADKGAYANCLFSDNGAEDKKTADLTWTSGKYFYNDAWYALNEIPVPLPDAVPLEGNIWKVTAETPLVAGSHYINEALLTMDGVYATNLKTNTRTIAGEEFTHAIQVRTDGYPTADKKAGKEKSGSTSLIITAKEDADVTFYYNRQVVGEGGTDNDNKDLVVFDQADITTKVAGVLTIDQILEGNNYMNVTKKVALKKDHTYTVTASGTTLQLHGIKLEAHFPVMQIAGAWNVQDEAWLLNDMSLAEDKLTATYEVELTPGDYEFKMIKDGAWLTKANEGQAYGLHREWPGVAGVIDNATENLKVTADVAGNYVFTWTFANDSIGIAFPAAPIEPDPAKFYITGDSALVVDAGLDAEMQWNPAAIKSQKDTFVLSNLKADQYYLLKVTLDGTWNEGMVKGFNDLTEEIAGLDDVGDDHNIGFKLAEAGDVQVVYFVKDEVLTFKLIGNFYVDQTPVDPQEEVTVYFVNTPRWDGVNIYLWNNETFENNAAWPGLAMTKEETKVQGFDVYSYTFVNSKNFDKCIFNHIDQTADLELHAGQYYCVDTWYESIEAIPELDIDEPSPIDPTTAHFYIKHAGNNWTWVEMTYDAVMDAFTYQSVWAGNGANINTVGEDNGNAWYPAAMINVAEDVELRDTVLFAYNYNTKALSVTLVGKYVQKLANGYYIIGLNGWNVDDLSESDDLFYSTGIETGEFSLETTLTEGAVFKVVRVEGDVIINWYGIQTSEQNPDGNYIVDAAHAGEKTIYFRPEWNEDWAGHIYVAPNETTAISNTAADAEAVKVLHNGMLLIRKGDKTYNIMGQAVK